MVEALERLLFRLLHFNPAVAWHELRMRMRVGRAFRLLGTYALLAGLAVGLPVWFVWSQAVRHGVSPPTDLGRTGLHALTYVQLTLIFITLPAFAASTIAGERERETLEMLRATLLTPWDVVTGKLLSVLAFGTILLAATVPVASWCLLLGGVSPAEVFRIYMLLLATAWWVTSLGVLMSTHFARTLGAIVATYGTILGAGILTGLIAFGWGETTVHGGGPGLGPTRATVVVALLAVATAVIAGALVRRVINELPPLRGRVQSTILRTISIVVFVGMIIVTAMLLINQLAMRAPMSLLLVNPYVGAAVTLEEGLGQDLLRPPSPTATPTSAPSAAHVWLLLMWVYVTAALGMWLLSVHSYARKNL